MSIGMSTSKEIKEEATPGCYIKARYSLVAMEFLAMMTLQLMRSNISVAVVAMVNSTETDSSSNNASNQSDLCPDRGQASESQANSNGIFDWNAAEQGLVLGCYYYGYFASNIPGAWLSKKFGMKYVVGASFAIASVLTLCSPIIASFSFEMFVAFRALLGLVQGVSSPAFLGAWGRWAPLEERSMLVSIYLSGVSVGYFLVFFLGGIITQELGWEAIFYIPGGIAAVWTVCWFLLAFDSPEDHPRISEQEKRYILDSTGTKHEVETKAIPWKGIFTSIPMYAIMVALFANNWTNYSLQSMLPTYMSSILRYDLSQGGIWSSLPYIFKWLSATIGGMLTDFVHRKKIASIVVIRKVNTTIALLLPALFVVLAGYVGCNATAAIAFFTLSLAFNGVMSSGCISNAVDIAPSYSGIVFGICNTVANTSGFLAPQVTGWILLDGNSLSQWHTVFWLAAGIDIFGFLVYVVFGSGTVQQWVKVSLNENGLENQAYEDEVTYM